jgi:hypothetical protein
VVRLQTQAAGRWLNGDLFETSHGLRLEAEQTFADAQWTTAFSADVLDARLNEARDGERFNLEAARTRYVGPSALWRVGASVTRREAQARSEAYWQGHLSVGRLAPAPGGLLVYAEPYVLSRVYDGRAFAFRDVREDFEYGVTVRASKRDWSVWGAFPFAAVTLTRNESSLDLNSFSRERLEFGWTRTF